MLTIPQYPIDKLLAVAHVLKLYTIVIDGNNSDPSYFFAFNSKTYTKTHPKRVQSIKVVVSNEHIFSSWWFQIFFGNVSPRKIGDMIQFDEHIFQMGWFNHQPPCPRWKFRRFQPLSGASTSDSRHGLGHTQLVCGSGPSPSKEGRG